MAEQDGIFTEVLNSYVDRHKRGQELQRIGEQVVQDCAVYGMSVWKRNEDGSITPVDPSEVTFLLPEPEADGSFTNQLVRSQIAKRNAKTTAEQRFQAGVEEVHQQFLAEKRAEQSEPWNEPWNEQRFQGPGENDG